MSPNNQPPFLASVVGPNERLVDVVLNEKVHDESHEETENGIVIRLRLLAFQLVVVLTAFIYSSCVTNQDCLWAPKLW